MNTICNATSTRQTEAESLAKDSDAMIVIGGTHSSNSRKLYEICKNQCENTFFIQTAEDLPDIPGLIFCKPRYYCRGIDPKYYYTGGS